MKNIRLLPISLLLNLLLLGTLFLAWHKRPSVTRTDMPVAVSILSTTPTTVIPPPKAPAFSWSNIEASDYPTYIANLRAFACPEQTIRDIITADVSEIFRKKRKELLSQSGFVDTSILHERIRQLEREESQVILKLLGALPDKEGATPVEPALGVAQETASANEAPSQPQKELKQEPVSIPLVLFAADLQSTLDPSQKEQVKTMVAEFTKAVGGLNQNPNDPAYLERWHKAQADFDELLHSKLGDDVYGTVLGRSSAIPVKK